MSMEYYNDSKVQVRFNDEIFIGRKDHAIKRNNLADKRLREFYSTEKVKGDMYDLVLNICTFTISNKYKLESCNC